MSEERQTNKENKTLKTDGEIVKTETTLPGTTLTMKELATGKNWTSYVLVTFGLLVLLGLTIMISNLWVRSTAEDLLRDFKLENSSTECKLIPDKDRQAFIAHQKTEIIKYGENHRKTAIYFYGYFYATFAVFSLFGIISAISLTIIAKKGYDFASPHLITVFMVSTGIVILYQGFFGVFQQKANIDNNARLFSNYSKLLTKIDTYCTTGKIPIIEPTAVFTANLAKIQPAANAAQTPNTNTATNTNGATAQPTATPAPPTKTASFYIALDADEFLNYVGWQMEQYKAISIALDDKQITSIDNSRFLQP